MNNISLALKVSDFTFDPQKITDLIGFIPSRFYIKGEEYFIGPPDNRTMKTRESNYWEYRIHINNNNVWIQTVIDAFIRDVISEKREKWLVIKDAVDIELYIGLYFNSLDGLDNYHFDKKYVELLSDLKIEIDIDQYIENVISG